MAAQGVEQSILFEQVVEEEEEDGSDVRILLRVRADRKDADAGGQAGSEGGPCSPGQGIEDVQVVGVSPPLRCFLAETIYNALGLHAEQKVLLPLPLTLPEDARQYEQRLECPRRDGLGRLEAVEAEERLHELLADPRALAPAPVDASLEDATHVHLVLGRVRKRQLELRHSSADTADQRPHLAFPAALQQSAEDGSPVLLGAHGETRACQVRLDHSDEDVGRHEASGQPDAVENRLCDGLVLVHAGAREG
mmetsp:Transcript_31503/g.70884  ORF Transcript_31503/g.70884 Transcript_31503/m.70884 type:complete len:251 (-) Transcript_31503:1222-1974(-)